MSKSLVLCCIVLLLIVGMVKSVPSQAEALPVTVEGNYLIEGTVVEIINAGGYSYVCIENSGQLVWATTRGAMVEVGEEVAINGGSVMTNFTSEFLGRTFDTIIFTNKISRH